MTCNQQFAVERGVFVLPEPILHRGEEYDERGFDTLLQMQRNHFWYRGRHKLLLTVLRRELARSLGDAHELSAIDMGGGCGGWLEFLHTHDGGLFQRLALADSSMRALSLAESVVGSFAARYQVDLLDLPWDGEWDVVFLLDVLEHIPNQEEAFRQIRRSLRPGGLLFVTVPALSFFWTYNDNLAHHQGRYCKRDFQALGERVGLKVQRTEYFMFLLSPALLISRMLFRPPSQATLEECRAHMQYTHQVPIGAVNALLAGLFSLESRMVNFISFPWGTSVIAVFQR